MNVARIAEVLQGSTIKNTRLGFEFAGNIVLLGSLFALLRYLF